jgi:hypothetical protein
MRSDCSNKSVTNFKQSLLFQELKPDAFNATSDLLLTLICTNPAIYQHTVQVCELSLSLSPFIAFLFRYLAATFPHWFANLPADLLQLLIQRQVQAQDRLIAAFNQLTSYPGLVLRADRPNKVLFRKALSAFLTDVRAYLRLK